VASYNVQELKFLRPQPEVATHVITATLLGPHHAGWTAVVDEDVGVMVIKARKTGPDGKVKTRSFRFPLSSIDWYVVTAAKVSGDEPADPK
jgi:hypothetical protein